MANLHEFAQPALRAAASEIAQAARAQLAASDEIPVAALNVFETKLAGLLSAGAFDPVAWKLDAGASVGQSAPFQLLDADAIATKLLDPNGMFADRMQPVFQAAEAVL